MPNRIDHVGITVNNIEEALTIYTDVLGLKATDIHMFPEQELKIAVIPIGDSKIELLGPIDVERTAEFVTKWGQGIHHICLEVNNIDDELRTLIAKGVELKHKEAQQGLSGRIAFLHPKATKGALIELIEKT